MKQVRYVRCAAWDSNTISALAYAAAFCSLSLALFARKNRLIYYAHKSNWRTEASVVEFSCIHHDSLGARNL
jgi:hypothetical protein